MKKSIIYKLILGIYLLIQSQLLISQSCTIDYIDTYSHEFPIEGGSIYVTIHTYPYNCGPELSFPSWITMFLVSEETYMIGCAYNSETNPRYGSISVGNDFIDIYQEGTPLIGGTIGGPNGESYLSICYNTSPGTLTNQAEASGGDCSPYYDYQWQISSDGAYYTDISGATGLTYNPGVLTTYKYFRRKVTCYGVDEYSNSVYIFTTPLSGGTISGAQTICFNIDASNITNIVSPSGALNYFTYQWQSSTNGGYSWDNISGASQLSYDPPALTINTDFRRMSISDGNCGTVYSTTITKTVRSQLLSGSISGDQLLCTGDDAGIISNLLEANGGSNSYIYSWEKSTNGGSSWTPESGNSTSFDPSALTTTTLYRRKVTDNEGCGILYSLPVTKTVRTLSTAPSGISLSNNNQCPETPITLSIVGGSLGTGAVWKWYTGSCGSTNIGQGTAINVNPSVSTIYYVRAEGDCNTTNCANATVTVKTNSTAPSGIIISPNNVCPGTSVTLTIDGGALGTDASWKWYSGSCGGTFVNEGPSIQVISSLSTTYYVRAEGCNTTVCASNTLSVKALPSISIQPTNLMVESTQNALFSISASGTNLQYVWESSPTAYGSWTALSGPPAINFNTANLTVQPLSPLTTKFYRCKIISDCQTIYSNSVSLSYKPEIPQIISQTPSNNLRATGTSFSMRAYSNNGVDWTNQNIWNFWGPGSISWDESKQAWKVVGYILMYLKHSNAIPIDVNRSYKISVEVLRENHESKVFYWGGRRLAADKTTELLGIGGWFDYSAAIEAYPTVGQWVTYSIEAKTGTENALNGWNNDNCAYYSVGGLVNYDGPNTQVTYIRNIEFFETGLGYSYQWKKNDSDISGANSPSYTLSSITHQDAGSYKCLISSPLGSDLSDPITLDVKDAFTPASLSSDQNYIYIQEPNKEVLSESDIASLCFDEIRHSVQYFDGLGRLIQTNQIAGAPDRKDLIAPNYYDPFGRESVKYLPYGKSGNNGAFVVNSISDQASFYNTPAYFQGDKALAKTVFEDSPLNRIIEQGAPGKYWQPSNSSHADSGHTVKYSYLTNGANEVIKWTVTGDEIIKNGYYPANRLYKFITKDENWQEPDGLLHTTEEFKDLQGNVILKRTYVENGAVPDTVDTYYVYDDFGLLRYVLPPKAIENIGSATNFLETTPLISDLCFYYKYNLKKQLSRKKLPGADPIYFIYDKRDRLILTQDGNYRHEDGKKWLYTKYDALNRPVVNGDYIYEGSTSIDEIGMQNYIDGLSYPLYETYSEEANNVYYYTNISFPTNINSDKVLTVTYYDNYDFDDASVRGFANGKTYCQSIDNADYPISLIESSSKGRITGTKTRVLNRDGAITGEAMALTLYLYDSKDRVVRSLSINHMGGEDLIANKYDFVGNLLKSLQIHRLKNIASPPEVKLTKTYNYDHSGRLLSIDQNLIYDNIDKGTTRISELTYNDIGQLQSKKLYGGSSNTLLQTVDYSYNIRGWLTSINNGTLSNGDFFGMNLCYETIPTGTNAPSSEPQFNGNISSILWKSYGDTKTNAYGYHYDGLNRLKEADYANKDEAETWTNTLALGETNISYDKNGNIAALKRYDDAGTMIDNLTYTYGTTNILQSAKDTEGNKDKGDYPGTANQECHYTYDENGNMISDNAKGISIINYNYLNLPEKITFGSFGAIDYTYNADGKKLRKKVLQGSTTTYHHYIGGFEYLETTQGTYVLSLLQTEEGVVINDVNGEFKHTPILKDHLGSTRVVVNYIENQVTAVQKNNYYPFGLKYNDEQIDNFKYLYNGKELQDEMFNSKTLDWYDYGARFYDPQIGRFTTQDRYAEKYLSITPFQYAANNPIRFIDVNGDSIVYRNESTAKYIASFTSKTTAKKNGKVVENKNYNERFAEIIQKLDDSKTIYEFSDSFTPIKGAEQGQISTDGEKVSVEFSTPDESYGSKSNLLFEETFHAYQVEKKSITINKEKKRFNMYLPEVEYEYEAKKFAVSAPSGSFSFTNPTGITAKTQIGLIKYLNPYEGRRFLTDGYTERTFNGSTPVNNIYFAPYPPKK